MTAPMQKLYGVAMTVVMMWAAAAGQGRPRARDVGIAPGVLAPGTLNARRSGVGWR